MSSSCRADEKRLVKHRRKQRIGDAVSRDVDQHDARALLTAFQMRSDLGAVLRQRLVDARRQIEPLLEVDINKVVAADVAVSRDGAPVDVDAVQPRQLSGCGGRNRAIFRSS
jgi:hypothetical protein